MKYHDGDEILVGDIVSIDERYRGRVVACMSSKKFLPGFEHWTELGDGIMVDTDFGGMVHYTETVHDELRLLERSPDVSLR